VIDHPIGSRRARHRDQIRRVVNMKPTMDTDGVSNLENNATQKPTRVTRGHLCRCKSSDTWSFRCKTVLIVDSYWIHVTIGIFPGFFKCTPSLDVFSTGRLCTAVDMSSKSSKRGGVTTRRSKRTRLEAKRLDQTSIWLKRMPTDILFATLAWLEFRDILKIARVCTRLRDVRALLWATQYTQISGPLGRYDAQFDVMGFLKATAQMKRLTKVDLRTMDSSASSNFRRETMPTSMDSKDVVEWNDMKEFHSAHGHHNMLTAQFLHRSRKSLHTATLFRPNTPLTVGHQEVTRALASMEKLKTVRWTGHQDNSHFRDFETILDKEGKVWQTLTTLEVKMTLQSGIHIGPLLRIGASTIQHLILQNVAIENDALWWVAL
jgi:hypothetical protein